MEDKTPGPLNCLKMIQLQSHQVVKRCRKRPSLWPDKDLGAKSEAIRILKQIEAKQRLDYIGTEYTRTCESRPPLLQRRLFRRGREQHKSFGAMLSIVARAVVIVGRNKTSQVFRVDILKETNGSFPQNNKIISGISHPSLRSQRFCFTWSLHLGEMFHPVATA